MVRLEEFMEIFRLKEQGYNISAISRMTGRDRKTVRKYLKGGRDHPPKRKSVEKRASKLDGYVDQMKELLGEGVEFVPATVIYERLVERGYSGSLSLIQKWVKNYKRQRFPKVVIRYETGPGQQAQVDWGEKRILDRVSGLRRRVYIFCMILCYSRMRFVHFVERADMYHFLLCHQLAFEYFGGMPREILYDQNRCVVIRPGYHHVVYNEKFLDFAHHYCFLPRVCRPYRPETKGKVENLVKYVKGNFLCTQDRNDISLLNRRKKSWLDRVNSKVHSTTGAIPQVRLQQEDLISYDDVSVYDVCYRESRRVFHDSTISFQGRRYSVPPAYIGYTVSVKHRPMNARFEVYANDQLITTHRSDGGSRYVIKRSHRHEIWKLWRDEQHQYYRKASQNKTAGNHPLVVYEALGEE